ncbi:MAG: Rrf2 family transcriptional regulator [Gallionella sp.]|jgi:Rrf2 family protein|nr:Rrf2 family transcriptional regulator [Gallionella sp.]
MRLEITRKADIATRALLALSTNGARSKSSELAKLVGTTPGFLSHAMLALVQRGWVRSDPGPLGGYSATFNPKEVSVLDVIEAVEGPTDVGRCVLENRSCSEAGQCALHSSWSSARADLLTKLSSISLHRLMSENPS